MPAEVYSLSGCPLPSYENPGEPVEDVIETLTALLEKAMAGELAGVCLVGVSRDNSTELSVAGRRTYAMVGRLEAVKKILLDDLA